MTFRRWETWIKCYFGDEFYERRIGRHFFRWTARLRISREPSTITAWAVDQWNATWPSEKIHDINYEVRRRA